MTLLCRPQGTLTTTQELLLTMRRVAAAPLDLDACMAAMQARSKAIAEELSHPTADPKIQEIEETLGRMQARQKRNREDQMEMLELECDRAARLKEQLKRQKT
jgi:hypothetical protein